MTRPSASIERILDALSDELTKEYGRVKGGIDFKFSVTDIEITSVADPWHTSMFVVNLQVSKKGAENE